MLDLRLDEAAAAYCQPPPTHHQPHRGCHDQLQQVMHVGL